MKIKRMLLGCVCSLTLIIGCARNDDAGSNGSGAPSTQPTAVNSSGQPAMAAGEAATAPSASMLLIDKKEVWFAPARLRLNTWDGKVVARLYSDDPSGVLTGKETVNSYDFKMVLPDISDVGDIGKTAWVSRSSSSDKQDTPYGIFLNNQQEVLQPMDVTVRFQRHSPRVTVQVEGTFWEFRMSDESPNAAPAAVRVIGVLQATVPATN